MTFKDTVERPYKRRVKASRDRQNNDVLLYRGSFPFFVISSVSIYLHDVELSSYKGS